MQSCNTSAGSCNFVVFDKFTHAYKHPIALVITFIPILIIYWEALLLNDLIVRKVRGKNILTREIKKKEETEIAIGKIH